MSLNMNFHKLSDHAPKECYHCKTRTAKGSYQPTTKNHQAWLCDRCKENKK